MKQRLVALTTQATTQCFFGDNHTLVRSAFIHTSISSDKILKTHIIKGQYWYTVLYTYFLFHQTEY